MSKIIDQLVAEGRTTAVKKSKLTLLSSAVYYLIGIALSLLFIFPILYMIAASTKTDDMLAHEAGTIMMFIPNFTNPAVAIDNYAFVLVNTASSDLNEPSLLTYFVNTLIYAAVVIVFNIFVNGLAGYVIAKMRFPGKRFFWFIVMFLIVVPVETSIIPLYEVVVTMLHLKPILGGAFDLGVFAFVLPAIISIFNIFLFVQFFSSIPKDFIEAARIDGLSDWKIFYKIILPMSKPIIATVAVFSFIGVWNDYLWPTMVITTPMLRPIQAGLESIKAIEGVQTGAVMASLVITSLPIFIIYIAAQKYIVQGFGKAALKI